MSPLLAGIVLYLYIGNIAMFVYAGLIVFEDLVAIVLGRRVDNSFARVGDNLKTMAALLVAWPVVAYRDLRREP